MNVYLIIVKVGKRQQQNRTGEGRTGAKPKEVCPECKKEYLQSFYGKEGSVLKTMGKYCPGCDYCRKNEKTD